MALTTFKYNVFDVLMTTFVVMWLEFLMIDSKIQNLLGRETNKVENFYQG